MQNGKFIRFKGIDLRYLHIYFLYHSKELKFLHRKEPFVCFLNFVFVSNFSIFACQRGELTLSQSKAQRQDIFLLDLHTKLTRALDTLSAGLQRAPPRTGTVSILTIFPPKQHLHERRSGLPVRGYNRSCGKSNSPAPQGKLSTSRRENEILKANERLNKV
jgi:hypothetical protein